MKIETRFDIGERVRVTLGGDFIAVVKTISVYASNNASESYVGYTVILPEEQRGRGRNYTEIWGYREESLEKVNP